MPKTEPKKVTKRIITKADSSASKKEEPVIEAAQPVQKQTKKCMFCQTKTIPTYTDIAALRRFLTDRSRIVPKLRTGVCSKHQRGVSRQIKYARHLALLPFTPKV